MKNQKLSTPDMIDDDTLDTVGTSAAKIEVEVDFQGAEGRVRRTQFLGRPCITKERFSKKYRHPVLDTKITYQRLVQESRFLIKCRKFGIDVPVLYHVDVESSTMFMEEINGCSVKEFLFELDKNESKKSSDEIIGIVRRLCEEIGKKIAQLHNSGIIHGDLTTSNMLLRGFPASASNTIDIDIDTFPIVFIDFGLSSHSFLEEDRAVDLYVCERAFISTHPGSEIMINAATDAYFAHIDKPKSVRTRYADVRSRGRKRNMVG